MYNICDYISYLFITSQLVICSFSFDWDLKWKPDPPTGSGVAEPTKIIELEDLPEAKGQKISEGNCGEFNPPKKY